MSGPPPVYPPSAEEREYAQHYAARAASPSYAYSYGLDESGPSHVPPQSQSSRVPIPSRMESGDSVYSHATPTMGSTYPPRVQRVPSTDGKDHPSTSGQPARKYGPEYPEGWTDEDMAAEAEFLKKGMIEWRDVLNWRFWIRLKWWCELTEMDRADGKIGTSPSLSLVSWSSSWSCIMTKWVSAAAGLMSDRQVVSTSSRLDEEVGYCRVLY